MLSEIDRPLSVVFELQVPDEVAVERLRRRAEEEGRADDTPELIRKRIEGMRVPESVGEYYRTKGLLFGIELVEDRESRAPASNERVAKVISGCKERGLIVGKNGDTVAGFNNVITLAPPLVVSDDDLEFISDTLKESL